MKTALLLLVWPAALLAQFVDGIVYDAVSGAPLAGVSVTSNGPAPVVRTDASGHFRIQLQPNYAPMVAAAKAGYLQFNQRLKTTENVRIELKPEAVITGKITDEDGFPAGGAQLQMMKYQVLNGRRVLAWAGVSQNDERGQYRIDNLAAGRYYIRVYSNDAFNWDHRYVSQYLGGTLKPDDSHIVEVKTGETRKDLDIQLVRFEGVTVTGRVEGATGNARGMGNMVSLTTDQAMPGASPASVTKDGTFTLRHVPPGTYTLRYGEQIPHAGDMSAQLPVEIADHDVRDLLLAPHVVQAVDLAGQLQLREGGPAGPWIVYLRPRFGTGVSAHTDADGSFLFKGLLPEHYAVQVMNERRPTDNPPKGHVVAVLYGDQDAQEKGFDLDGAAPKPLRITASNLYANLTGAIVDSQGAPVANANLCFQSTNSGLQGHASTNDKGSFRALLAEPGEYRVYVIDADAASTVVDDEYMKAHQGDFPMVHVALGDNPSVTLARNPRPSQ